MGERRWVRADRALAYTIRFENDPVFAEAPAQWDEPVFISAVEVDPNDPTKSTGSWGAYDQPIQLQNRAVDDAVHTRPVELDPAQFRHPIDLRQYIEAPEAELLEAVKQRLGVVEGVLAETPR